MLLQQKKDRRILITGGAGFIGTHLVNALAGRYPDTTLEIVDDLSSSTVSPARRDFFREQGMIFNRMTVEEFIPPTNVRYGQIYHLACKVGPAHVLKYAGRMGSEIVSDAMKMADLAIRDRASLVSISTSEVYGRDPNGLPQHEDLSLEVTPVPSARLEYTLGKLMTEISLLNLASVNPELYVNLIRPFNVVGPLQTGEGGYVLPRFTEAALRGYPLTVFGDGTQTRSFTHVADVVNALLIIIESGIRNRIYNVGTPENTCAIENLARRVIKLTGSTSKIWHVDPRTIFGERYTEAESKIASIDRITSELGWTPRWSLDEIIRDYAAFVRGGVSSVAVVAT